MNIHKKIFYCMLLLSMKSSNGMSVLTYAVKHDNLEAAKLLLQHGADPFAKDKDGKSAFDYASPDAKKILLEEFAKAQKISKKQPKAQQEEKKDMDPLQEFIASAKMASPREILGVASDADDAKIGKAFRKLSLKYHPDKWPEQKTLAAEAYKIIVNARDSLVEK